MKQQFAVLMALVVLVGCATTSHPPMTDSTLYVSSWRSPALEVRSNPCEGSKDKDCKRNHVLEFLQAPTLEPGTYCIKDGSAPLWSKSYITVWDTGHGNKARVKHVRGTSWPDTTQIGYVSIIWSERNEITHNTQITNEEGELYFVELGLEATAIFGFYNDLRRWQPEKLK